MFWIKVKFAVVALAAAGWAGSTAAAQDGSGVFFPEKQTRLYQTRHGEPPGYPGCLEDRREDGSPKYPRWGNPELQLYEGSVEHYRGEQQKYLPAWAMFESTSLVRNFRATELPGIAPGAIEDYAEPVYYLPMYGQARDTGKRNPPVKVVRCRAGAPVFRMGLGELNQGLYCVRFIGACETPHAAGIRQPVYVELKVNDGSDGAVSRYRKRCGYTDNFYSVAEFYFYAPLRRAYSAELCLGDGTQVDILAYNIEVHDACAGLVRDAIKNRISTFDPKAREAARQELRARVQAGDRAWLDEFRKKNYIERDPAKPYRAVPLIGEERQQRDDQIWHALPPLNCQSRGGYGTAPFGPGTPEAKAAFAGGGKWRLAGAWDTRWELVNDQLKLRYTWEDLRDHKPLPAPWPVREDAGGFTLALQPGEKYPATMATIAEASGARIGDFVERLCGRAVHWAGLANFYHFTGDLEAARDAALALVRVAYLTPSWDEARMSVNAAIGGHSDDLNWGGKDQWTNRRLDRSNRGLYNHEPLAATYDRLFDFIQGNEELASAVNRYVPWVRTPADLVAFLDMNLLQYGAKREVRWNTDQPNLLGTVMAVGNTEFTRPWMDFLFRQTWEYPNARSGMPDYAIAATQRDGTSYIGSWFYGMDGGPAMQYAASTSEYVRYGGDPKYDLSDFRRFPKALAACNFQIEGRVAGLHALGVGDVNNPGLPYGHWFTLGPVEAQARRGWSWSKDPRHAYILANYFSAKGETPEEWAAIRAAAEGVPNPWITQRSRVLSNWAAILEGGVRHTDFRFRRGAMVRVGYGWGHQHDDVLDLILWAHGVIHAAVGGERPEQRQFGDVHSPGNQASYTHNMVEVDGAGGARTGRHRGHSWTRALADTEGARYVMAESYPFTANPYVSLYRRQVALIDVDEGTPPADETAAPKESHPTFKLPTVQKTPDAYVFDVFRVRGGKRHTYCFHGCEEDEFTSNALNVRKVGARYGDHADAGPEANYLNKFLVDDCRTAGVAPGVLQATWRLQRGGDPIVLALPEKDAAGKEQPTGGKEMRRRNTEAAILGANYDANSPRKYTRLHLFDHEGIQVLTGKWVATSPSVSLQCLFAQRDLRAELKEGEPGDMQTVFPAVIEMFEGEPVIEAAQSVAVQGNETDALRAAALELTLAGGRTDLCFADGRPEKVRTLANGVQVSGEFAFVSTDAGGLRQATLVGGALLKTPQGIALAATAPERKGRVTQLDYLEKRAVVQGMKLANPVLLKGASVEIGVPEHMTSYMVSDAALKDGAVTLTFDKGMDYYSSRVLEVNQKEGIVRCGLGLPTDGGAVFPGMDKGLMASNEARTKFWRAEYQGGTREEGYAFKLTGGPVSAADFGEKGALRIWEFGVGDELRQPTHVSLRRNADGTFTLQADVECRLSLKGAALESSLDGRTWTPVAGAAREAGGITAAIREDQLGAGTLKLRLRD